MLAHILTLIWSARLAGFHTTFESHSDGSFTIRAKRIRIVETVGRAA